MKVWSQHQIDCLQAMGITQWQLKTPAKSAQIVDPLLKNIPSITPNQTKVDAVAPVLVGDNKQGVDENSHFLSPPANWPNLNFVIKNCTNCERHKYSAQPLIGEGNTSAKLFIIGDAPTVVEDNSDKPFSGDAGELFNKMLSAINIKRESVYLTNFVKCHLVESSVSSESFNKCFSHLQNQIDKVNPSLILIFSEQAAQYILKNQSPLHLLRQQVHLSVNQIKTIVTYSPQLLLDDAGKKRAVWEDLKFAQKTLLEHNIEL